MSAFAADEMGGNTEQLVAHTTSDYKVITISWNQISDASVYKVYRSTSKTGTYKLVKTGKALKFQDANTKINKTYYYKVEADRNAEKQEKIVSQIVSQKKIVAAATVKSATMTSYTSAKVKWKKVSGAQGYRVYYATSKSGPYKKAVNVSGRFRTSATVKHLKKGTRYYFQVRAYRKSGSKKCFSAAGIGKITTIPLSMRMNFLFPGGAPKSEAQMKKYLVPIIVPIRDADGNKSTITLLVHRAVKDDFIAAFDEMYRMNFPVRAEDTGTYKWRKMASSNKQSHHSYGVVADINWDSNPMLGVSEGAYRPYVDPYSVTPKVVAIWKKYGFYWGGDWKSTKDYMHFTYTNH